MSDTDKENKAHNREIAENEAERQTTSDFRVSGWAIAVAVLIGLAAFVVQTQRRTARITATENGELAGSAG